MSFKHLVSVIRQSIYGPRFYAHVATQLPLKESIRYFYSLVLILSVVLSLVLGAALIPTLQFYMTSVLGSAVSGFPSDLTLHLQNGLATTDEVKVYTIPMTDDLKPMFSDSTHPAPANLLVVDTDGLLGATSSVIATSPATSTSLAVPASIEDRFKATSTVFLLTRDSLITDKDGTIATQSLSGAPNLTITKASAESFAGKAARLARWTAPIVIFGLFIAFMALYSLILAFLFLGALVVLIIARIKKIQLSYAASYRVALHLSTLGILLYTFVLSWFPWPLQAPTTLTLFLIVLAWVNLDPVLIASVSGEGKIAEAPAAPKPTAKV